MIKRLFMKNFGPYENASISLDEFTVILGQNGAGKSLLFSALKAIGRVAKFPLRYEERRPHQMGGYPTRTGQVGFDQILHRGESGRTIMLRVEFEAGDLSGEYEVHLRSWHNPAGTIVEERLEAKSPLGNVKVVAHPDGKVENNLTIPSQHLRTPRFVSIPGRMFKSRVEKESSLGHKIQEALADRVGIFRFDPTALKTPAEMGKSLSPTGYNFAAYLDQIRNEPGGKEEFEALLGRFRKLCPHVEDILLPLEQSSDREARKRLAFVMAGSKSTIPGDLESDGTILLLAYASLLHGSRAYDTICFEEPENGIHPKAVPAQVSMLMDLTKPNAGRAGAQILVCTHSKPFLDVAKNTPGCLRLVRRGGDGRSTVDTPGPQQLPAVAGWAGLT